MKALALTVVAAGLLVLVVSCGGDGNEDVPSGTGLAIPDIDPADLASVISNPLFPLSSGQRLVYEGEEVDPDTGETVEIRVESTVLPEIEVVAGVEVTVVEVKDFEDRELVERTLDYYAQHSDGTVYYLGERVDDYEDGDIVGHDGQWLAGEGGNRAGEFMPAHPQVGDEFEQEKAPGIAEDRSEVVAIDEAVTVPAGTFLGCIKTEDFDPIGGVTESKYYCPDVGLVREVFAKGHLDLISID